MSRSEGREEIRVEAFTHRLTSFHHSHRRIAVLSWVRCDHIRAIPSDVLTSNIFSQKHWISFESVILLLIEAQCRPIKCPKGPKRVLPPGTSIGRWCRSVSTFAREHENSLRNRIDASNSHLGIAFQSSETPKPVNRSASVDHQPTATGPPFNRLWRHFRHQSVS